MEKDGFAEAHVACAGEQKCRWVACGDVAIERCGGRLVGLAGSGLVERRIARGKGRGQRRVQAIHGVARVAVVSAAGAGVESDGAGLREFQLRQPEEGRLREGASSGGAKHADAPGLVGLEQFAIDGDDVFVARDRWTSAAIIYLDDRSEEHTSELQSPMYL